MKNKLAKQRGATLFLRLAVVLIGLGVLALCIFLLPVMWLRAPEAYPHDGYAMRVVVVAMYVTAIPFYVGIYKGWRLLNLIDKGQAFSAQSATLLQFIARCAWIIGFVYGVSLPFFYIWAQHVDAPGLMVIGLFLAGISLTIGVAMWLLADLLRK